MTFTWGNVSVIAGAVLAIVTGLAQKDPATIGAGVLTIVGVFVHPPTQPVAK